MTPEELTIILRHIQTFPTTDAKAEGRASKLRAYQKVQTYLS